ncbi:50S ribosomal protein L33 [Paenibacillus sacheonensis]|uniref:50S ribosomal protein L33 n=1 Tax=Paenibacillus sacheonensis TaxID=742054 RepID=A0A7X5BZC8_9BACL|nr:50S ribosomal protein L33 [Paenibacillus sacheonensis]MBM7568855.1 hypothetical protein [Paenibacillus sacheonensis]NBC72558.1 50S ribosomal protein L33 [Paenibacillus sacheonensis]
MAISKKELAKYTGKKIYAVKKDGTVVTGTLAQISGNRVVLVQEKGKTVKTKALLPLVLFDLLAIGLFTGFDGFGYGGYDGYGYGGYDGFY